MGLGQGRVGGWVGREERMVTVGNKVSSTLETILEVLCKQIVLSLYC